MFLAALVAVALTPAAAQAHHEQTKIAYFMHRCDRGDVLACIHRATLHRHISYTQARGIAWRESRYRPGVCNPRPIYNGEHACGLFQFIGSTWRSTPYGARSIFSAKWSSLAYAWMVTHGRLGEFSTA